MMKKRENASQRVSGAVAKKKTRWGGTGSIPSRKRVKGGVPSMGTTCGKPQGKSPIALTAKKIDPDPRGGVFVDKTNPEGGGRKRICAVEEGRISHAGCTPDLPFLERANHPDANKERSKERYCGSVTREGRGKESLRTLLEYFHSPKGKAAIR